MLSSPFSSFSQSFPTNQSNNSSKITPKDFFPTLAFNHPTISPLLFDYQIPSQPIIRKSKPSFFIFVISGLAVIICSSTGKLLSDLYSKSPIARERLRLPLIRPSSIVPLALRIRSLSDFYSGLWSLLNSLASPFRLQTTALESPGQMQRYLGIQRVPALATQMYSGVMRQTLAVHPACDSSSPLGPFSFSRISFWILQISFLPSLLDSMASILRKVSLRANSQLCLTKFLFTSNQWTKCLLTKVDISAPASGVGYLHVRRKQRRGEFCDLRGGWRCGRLPYIVSILGVWRVTAHVGCSIDESQALFGDRMLLEVRLRSKSSHLQTVQADESLQLRLLTLPQQYLY